MTIITMKTKNLYKHTSCGGWGGSSDRRGIEIQNIWMKWDDEYMDVLLHTSEFTHFLFKDLRWETGDGDTKLKTGSYPCMAQIRGLFP